MITTVLGQLASAVKWGCKQLLHTPVSLALIVVMWGLHIVFISYPEGLVPYLGLGMPYEIDNWHILICGLTTSQLGSTAIATLGVLVLAIPAERILGSFKFGLTAIILHLVVTPAAMISARSVEETGLNWWGNDLLDSTLLSPVGWIFGTAAFASAWMSVLWQRRTRMVLLALSLTLVLYSGTLSDAVALTAAIFGIASGMVIHPNSVQMRLAASRRESRLLLAVMMLCTTLGPVLAALNPLSSGPFSAVTQLIWEPEYSLDEVYWLCENNTGSQECSDAVLQAAQTGVGATIINLVPLIVYGVLALGLAKGRRAAWLMSIAAQIISIVVIGLQLWTITDFDDTNSILLITNGIFMILPWLITLVILIFSHRLFRVEIHHRALSQLILGVLTAIGVSAVLWVCGGLVLADHFHPQARLSDLLFDIPAHYFPPVLGELYSYQLVPHTQWGWMLANWTGVVFWGISLVSLYRALMSVPDPREEEARNTARTILVNGSGDHLSWMTLWPGNRYWFAPAAPGENQPAGYVAYRVNRGIAVTVGEPVLAANSSDPMVLATQFEDFATENGWKTAWYSVSSEFSERRKDSGFRRQHVAEESLLYCDNLEFKGKKFQNIRTARNRAAKEGISTLWARWEELDPVIRESIIALSEEWVAEKALPEMGFTLGGVEELKEPGTQLLIAVDDDHRVHGVTSWLPVYQKGSLVGYTLDFMRRDSHGFRTVMEFLLAEGALHAKEEGLEWVSLSGAPLARSEENTEEFGILDAVLEKVGSSMEPLYGFRSLAFSKNKFHPEHRDWYLCYNDELALPAIGLAITSCYVPDMKLSDAIKAAKVWEESQQPATGEESDGVKK
ncbi:DUF2156 domain-containing protein [Corynebacterium sp. 3HC-13]|uniref:bifunctional lysylphosphatidylglycerol flippase/synthetase MprF n=1 Tax=Corynebacterium poyangense TaxID=2684405 RepID=UPI001CC9E21E|nr:DUF2156 domain-containing protein [Corynebacterium poyangense]MBZ8177104.1 DUF2156 domain-containing protein [Corynebacterium poyangense]